MAIFNDRFKSISCLAQPPRTSDESKEWAKLEDLCTRYNAGQKEVEATLYSRRRSRESSSQSKRVEILE